MATILGTQNDINIQSRSSATPLSTTSAASLFVPLGRLFFSAIFIMSGFSHFSSDTVAYAASQNVPFASFLVPLSGVMAIIGGVSVLLGFRARWGALLLLAFLVPVTLMMHNFWTFTDPMMYQMQMAHFMKNLAMIGAALLIYYFGAGPNSIDNKPVRRSV